MGEVFRNNKTKLTIIIPLLFMLLSVVDARADDRELDVFERGYEYYLSYQPAKAVEALKIFLKDFPGSSVTDAVMFWLGKSSLQLRDCEEARKVFSDMVRRFPESPYIKYVKRELDTIDKTSPECKVSKPPADARKDEAEQKTLPVGVGAAEIEKQELLAEQPEGPKLLAEAGPVKSAKYEEQEHPAEKTAVDKAQSESEIVRVPPDRVDENAVEKKTESPGAGPSEIEKNIPPAEEDLPKLDKALPAEDGGSEVPSLSDVKAQADRKDYAVDSSSVLTRLDIKDVLWRSGNISEDIENEKLLYEEAKRLNILIDDVKYDELVLKYEFNSEQAEYLKRYLTLCAFIDRKLKGMPGERVMESLVVHYAEGDKYRKIVIAPELQKEARNGTPFDDIQKLYPDLVKMVITAYDSVDADVKEKIRYLQDNEIGVIWSEDGYLILKPVSGKLSYKPFEEAGPGLRSEIKTFIAEWLAELKRTKK